MSDRGTVFALFVGALLLEGFLLVRSGLLEWALSGPHTQDELRALLFDWRVLASVGVVTVIVCLAVQWIRLGAADKN